MRFKAFISYSHAADGVLAPALHTALYKFAKPWYRRRAMRIFRDKTTLAMTAKLWPAIERGLNESEYFLLLASPQAAQSAWVQKEVQWWLQHRSADTLFIVLTDGQVMWNEASGDFEWDATTALPLNLKGQFTAEPLHVDLRWAKTVDDLSLRHAHFRTVILDIAAPLHGKAKDDLDGEDVRQHRKVRKTIAAVLGVLAVLSVGLALATLVAMRQRNIAEERGRVSLSRQLAAQSLLRVDSELDLALLLSVEAYRTSDTLEARNSLLSALASRPHLRSILYPDRQDAFSNVSFSSDGVLLVSGSCERFVLSVCAQGSVRIWDAATGRHLRDLIGFNAGVPLTAFGPAGRWLLSEGGGRGPVMWSVESWQPDKPLIEQTDNGSYATALSPKGDRIAIADCVGREDGNCKGRIRIWDVSLSGKSGQSSSPTAHEINLDFANALIFLDSTSLASIGDRNEILLWSLPNATPSTLSSGRNETAQVLAVGPEKTLAAGGCGRFKEELCVEGALRLWNLQSKKQTRRLSGPHLDSITGIAFSPDGKFLATGSRDGTIVFRNAQNGDLLGRAIKAHSDRLANAGDVNLAFSKDSRTLASSGRDNRIMLWDAKVRYGFGEVLSTAQQPTTTAISPDGGTVAYAVCLKQDEEQGCTESDIRFHDLKTGREAESRLTGHKNAVTALAFSSDGRLLASGSHDQTFVWEAATGKVLYSSEAKVSEPTSFVFSADNRTLAATSFSGLFVWDLEKKLTVETPPPTDDESVDSLILSENGQIVASLGFDEIVMRDVAARKPIGSLPDTELKGTASFTHNGRLLAVGGCEKLENLGCVRGEIRLWDLSTRTLVRTPLRGHTGEISVIAFSPDDSLMASGDPKGNVILWDVASGQQLGLPLDEEARGSEENSTLAFTRDGTRLISSGQRVIVWDIQTKSWLERACQIANRNLTREEWRLFLGDVPYQKTCPGL